MMKQALALDPASYESHAVHRDGRIWAETNCYVDVWIELLHALGHEPVAALPFTFAIDFEGDQWTFFKFPASDLYDLYGVDVQELAIWRPLVCHVEEQVERGRPVLVEVDSYYLPDTAGSAYRCAHTKTTVAIAGIDVETGTLSYFHGQGLFQLQGTDFTDALHVGDDDPARMAPFAEFARVRAPGQGGRGAMSISIELLRRHLGLVPRENPFVAFRTRLARDLTDLVRADLETFHRYSFATLRQCGACFELAATYLRWLATQGERGLQSEIRSFDYLAENAKRLQFQLARTMARHVPLDLTPLDAMAFRWEEAIGALRARYQ